MNEWQAILGEIESVLRQVEAKCIGEFTEQLRASKRIFVVGEGRSGLMAKSFAMRLMHLGATVYVVGETITPAFAEGDVLVAVSGSGTTKNVLLVAEKVRSLGSPVLALTTNPESELATLATDVLHVPAATKYRRAGEGKSMQPLGSLFDQCAHLLFDSICLRYAAQGVTDNGSALARHSNLE